MFIHCTCTYMHACTLHVCVLSVWQGYQKVPETPLASCSVLKEDQEVWIDVQVSTQVEVHLFVVSSRSANTIYCLSVQGN